MAQVRAADVACRGGRGERRGPIHLDRQAREPSHHRALAGPEEHLPRTERPRGLEGWCVPILPIFLPQLQLRFDLLCLSWSYLSCYKSMKMGTGRQLGRRPLLRGVTAWPLGRLRRTCVLRRHRAQQRNPRAHGKLMSCGLWCMGPFRPIVCGRRCLGSGPSLCASTQAIILGQSRAGMAWVKPALECLFALKERL